MATKTTNYKLIKPSLTDAANITAMNENWDKIDAELTMSMLDKTYSVANSGELDAAINSVLNSIPSHSIRQFEVSFTAVIEPFGGGTYMCKLYKVGDQYATVEMRTYGVSSPTTWVRSMYGGQWKSWLYMCDSSHTHDASTLNGVLSTANGGTGKNNLAEVTVGFAHHPVMMDCSNRDINNLKSAGFYYGYTGMTNAKIENEISIFEVISYSTNWLLQRQTRLTDGKSWFRYFYSGSNWSDWYDIYSSKNKPTPSDIGAAPTTHGHGDMTTVIYSETEPTPKAGAIWLKPIE